MLVAYAGFDPNEDKPKSRRAQTYYELFAFGMDTKQIADKFKNISEAQVLKLVTIERCRLLGLPSPYGE